MIGITHIPIITITPITPTAFFSIAAHPITASVASPKIFPTTGITVETAAFVVFAVTPSTVSVKLPSRDKTVINSVMIIPNIHTVLEFKNLDIFDILISSDILDIIFKLVDINIIGNIKLEIVFPIKLTNNSNIGCVILAEVIEPVVNINVIIIGIILLVKPTKFCIVSFTKEILFEKLLKTIVVININSTKYVTCNILLLFKLLLIAFKILCMIIIINIMPYVCNSCFKFLTKYI